MAIVFQRKSIINERFHKSHSLTLIVFVLWYSPLGKQCHEKRPDSANIE